MSKIEKLKDGKRRFKIYSRDPETLKVTKGKYSYIPQSATNKQAEKMVVEAKDLAKRHEDRGVTRLDVLRWANGLCNILGVTGPSIGEVGEDWIRVHTYLSDSSRKWYARTIKTASEFFGDEPADLLELKDFNAYHKALVEKFKLATTTADQHIVILRSMMSWAVASDLVAVNRCSRVRLFGKRFKDGGKAAFSEKEVYELLRYTWSVNKVWHDIILFASIAGTSMGDTASLKWENVNEKEKVIRVNRRKTKTMSIIPIVDQINDILGRRKTVQLSECSFPYPQHVFFKGEPPKTDEMGGDFRKIMISAGIESKKTVTGSFDKSFHSLRYYAIENAENAGIPEDVRMKMFGHASRMVHRNYGKSAIESVKHHAGVS